MMADKPLRWEFIDSRNPCTPSYQRATYRGLEIRAVQDPTPANPFEEFDGEPPLVASGDRWLTDYSKGEIWAPFAGLSDAWFSRNWRKVAAVFGESEADLDRECREAAKDWRIPLAVARREIFETRASDAKPGSDGYGFRDACDLFARLWQLRDCEAITATSRGYSQSDWAELFIVATPAWAKRTGAPRATHRAQLEGARELYTAWAWGDCYGWEIYSPDGEFLDSVWGYYGTDHSDSGLEESAKETADHILAAAAERRAHRLAELIRNHVPLEKRAALLDEAARLESAHA